MKVARNISLFLLIAGSVLLVAGFACGGDDKQKQVETPAPSSTATVNETATATAIPSPTPSPTPFAGKIARFKIPRFNIDAPIEEGSVNANNEMETPTHGRENTDVVWYDSNQKPNIPFLGTRPGWGGNAVFSAHVYYINSAVCPNNPLACPGPFQKLAQSKVGDDVIITMENGAEYRYKVISYKQYTEASFPTGDVISPKDRPDGKEWITMITCGGSLDASGVNYVSRDVVVAERVQ